MAKRSGTTKYQGAGSKGMSNYVPPAPTQNYEIDGGKLKIYNIPSEEIQNLSAGAKDILQATEAASTERNTLNDAIMRAEIAVNTAIKKGNTRSIVRQQKIVKELEKLMIKLTK